jgi:FdhD protein
MAGPVGCGLCGIDSIDQALRERRAGAASDLPHDAGAGDGEPWRRCPIISRCTTSPAPPIAPAFWAGAAAAAREDVGRHNALDKLAGHLIRTPHPEGAVVLTSRVSTDMVQKVAAIGAPVC